MTDIPSNQRGPPQELRFRRKVELRASLNRLWRARPLVRSLAERDLRARYKQALLGFGWAVVPPLATVIVFTVLFDRVANINSKGTPWCVTSGGRLPTTHGGRIRWRGVKSGRVAGGQKLRATTVPAWRFATQFQLHQPSRARIIPRNVDYRRETSELGMSAQNVLIVSHEASRTGAPRVALEVLRSLLPLGVRRIAVLRWGGPLAAEFGREADQVVLEPLRRGRVLLRRHRRTRVLANWLEQVAAAAAILRYRPGLVYLNTVKSACYIRPALLLRCAVVLHVHELEPVASEVLARYHLQRLYPQVRLVACSPDVQINLSRLTGMDKSAISLIPSTVDAGRIETLAAEAPPGDSAVGARDIVVGACGTVDKRKGADLWLEVAALVRKGRGGEHVRFVWVGELSLPDLDERVRTLGLSGVVTFLGDLSNPYPAIAAMDIFTHPARQDPFPLVILEAMVLARPVIAFALDGVVEQLGDTGVVVPVGDCAAMAQAVLSLTCNPGDRETMGRRERERALGSFGIGGFCESTAKLVAEELSAAGRRLT